MLVPEIYYMSYGSGFKVLLPLKNEKAEAEDSG